MLAESDHYPPGILDRTSTSWAKTISLWPRVKVMITAVRQAGGATHKALVLCNVDDPHEIIGALGWRDLAKGKSFVQSSSRSVGTAKDGCSWLARSAVFGNGGVGRTFINDRCNNRTI
jgi:hypothetical protein